MPDTSKQPTAEPRYARIDEVIAGTKLIADGGFTCIKNGAKLTVEAGDNGDLMVPCRHKGGHYLDGQIDRDVYIGLTMAPDQ